VYSFTLRMLHELYKVRGSGRALRPAQARSAHPRCAFTS